MSAHAPRRAHASHYLSFSVTPSSSLSPHPPLLPSSQVMPHIIAIAKDGNSNSQAGALEAITAVSTHLLHSSGLGPTIPMPTMPHFIQ